MENTGVTEQTKEEAEPKPAVQPKLPKEIGPKEIGPKEIGGVKGPEPTRYGDWEHKGRCTDF